MLDISARAALSDLFFSAHLRARCRTKPAICRAVTTRTTCTHSGWSSRISKYRLYSVELLVRTALPSPRLDVFGDADAGVERSAIDEALDGEDKRTSLIQLIVASQQHAMEGAENAERVIAMGDTIDILDADEYRRWGNVPATIFSHGADAEPTPTGSAFSATMDPGAHIG